MIEARQLSVTFGGVRPLDGLDALLSEPVVGLIGPNGAGKTSMINVITGMVPCTAGSIRFRDQEISRAPAHEIARLGIGRTFQHVEIFSDQTVVENVLTGMSRHLPHGFWASALSLPRARHGERAARLAAEELLEAFDLTQYRDVLAGDLPFGVLKRLDLARALAARPLLLLLDEPTSGMSEVGALQAIETARTLARNHGISLFVIEHNMRVIMSLADTITVLDYGEKIAEGSPAAIQDDQAVIDAYLGANADA